MESSLVIWMNYAQNQILNRHGLVISTENVFNDTGNAHNTRESILRYRPLTGLMTLFSFDLAQSAPYIVT